MGLSREYHNQHYAVRNARGKATEHDCDCGKKARDWALLHGLDGSDIWNYIPMCRSCHMKYDKTKQGSNNHGNKINEEDALEIRRMYSSGEFLQREIAEKFQLSQGEISVIVNRKNWKHV